MESIDASVAEHRDVLLLAGVLAIIVALVIAIILTRIRHQMSTRDSSSSTTRDP